MNIDRFKIVHRTSPAAWVAAVIVGLTIAAGVVCAARLLQHATEIVQPAG